MDFNPLSILFSTLFGAMGLFYFKIGKSETRVLMMLSGVGLMAYSLFVRGPWLNLLVGSAIALVPWGATRLGMDF